MRQGSRTSTGFTLIELIVTMAVLSIVLAIAAYSFKDLLFKGRVTSAANELVGALNLARSEAVTRGRPVVVARIGSGSSWAGGWNVFVDTNDNGTLDSGEVELRIFPALRGGVTATGSGSLARVSYRNTGFAALSADAVITIANSAKTVNVQISKNGRVRTVN